MAMQTAYPHQTTSIIHFGVTFVQSADVDLLSQEVTAAHLIASHAGQGRGQTSITGEGELRLSLVWDDPHGGSGYDLYHLVDYNTLCVRSLICVENGTVTYNVMYRRKG